jgi:hypothetical protein
MKFGFLCLLTGVLICSHIGGRPQSSSLDVQRLAVAKVRVRHAGSGLVTGAAVYVGNDQQSGYFVTAYHTLDPDRGGSIESVELQFFNSPESFKGELVDKFDLALDLGVIKTSIKNIPSQIKQLFEKEPAPATAIRIIGHPSSGDWSVWSGRIENENAPQGDSHHFIVNRDNSLTPGYSGGAIFDVDGNFLGMHLETTASYGKELKSREIASLLAAFRVPTNNFGQYSISSVEDPPPTRPIESKNIKPSRVATAIDRDFDGNFDDFFTDQYYKLHIRKTDTNHPGALGPGEFRAALLFDLRVLPRNLSIQSATLSVSPSEINGSENINIEIYGFVDYLTIGLRTEAFIGGVKAAGPIKYLGQKAFVDRMNAIDVSAFMKQAIADGHRMIGFSIRQTGDFTKGIPFGTGLTIRSGEAPELRNSIEGTPHLKIEYQETP